MRYMYASFDPATGTYTRLPYEVCDWYKGFFRTGVTYTNSLAVDASDGHGSSLRVSVKDTRNDWIVPNTGFSTQNFTLSAISKRNKYIEAGLKLSYYRKIRTTCPWGIQQFVAPENVALATCERFGPRCIQRMEQRPAGRLLFGQRFFGEAD